MRVERTDKEIIIRVPSGIDLVGLQRILDFVRFREIISKSKVPEEEINELARQSKSDWWDKNKKKFIK